MSVFNSYKEPAEQVITEPAPGPFDINFNLPFPDKLETDKIRLVPFVPFIHAQPFHAVYSQHPELEAHLPIAWTSYPAFLTSFERYLHANPEILPLAIIDKTKLKLAEPTDASPSPAEISNLDECLAGMIGYVSSSTMWMKVEIGPVLIFPKWHRTFVSSHAIGLLMQYALNLPEEGGLGLRRVEWLCYPDNAPSLKTAARMGFTFEGRKKWYWVVPEGREGKPVDGKRGDEMGADNMCHAVCWDDWEGGVKDLVQGQIDREA